jgi:hypothetical protein
VGWINIKVCFDGGNGRFWARLVSLGITGEKERRECGLIGAEVCDMEDKGMDVWCVEISLGLVRSYVTEGRFLGFALNAHSFLPHRGNGAIRTSLSRTFCTATETEQRDAESVTTTTTLRFLHYMQSRRSTFDAITRLYTIPSDWTPLFHSTHPTPSTPTYYFPPASRARYRRTT